MAGLCAGILVGRRLHYTRAEPWLGNHVPSLATRLSISADTDRLSSHLGFGLGLLLLVRHPIHYLYCRYAHRADPAQQVDDPLLVVGKAVCVELLTDGRVPGLPLLVLVQHPLQGGAAPQLSGLLPGEVFSSGISTSRSRWSWQ